MNRRLGDQLSSTYWELFGSRGPRLPRQQCRLGSDKWGLRSLVALFRRSQTTATERTVVDCTHIVHPPPLRCITTPLGVSDSLSVLGTYMHKRHFPVLPVSTHFLNLNLSYARRTGSEATSTSNRSMVPTVHTTISAQHRIHDERKVARNVQAITRICSEGERWLDKWRGSSWMLSVSLS